MDRDDSRCVLLFSGGRDSTLAAVRLYRSGVLPELVTVSASHLNGVEAVRRRVRELTPLCAGVGWSQITQPELITSELQAATCLPCQLAYALVGAAIAVREDIGRIAFGYTAYQSDWPEQTPTAIEHLRKGLSTVGLELLCPVSDLCSREQAVEELGLNGLSSSSLEQKCTRQQTNVALPSDDLQRELSTWRALLDRALQRLPELPLEIISTTVLGHMTSRAK